MGVFSWQERFAAAAVQDSKMIEEFKLSGGKGKYIILFFYTLDALQFVEGHGDVCPADWHQSNKAIQTNQEGLEAFFGQVLRLFMLSGAVVSPPSWDNCFSCTNTPVKAHTEQSK